MRWLRPGRGSGGVIRQHVVGAVVLDDALKAAGDVVAVDDREPAGFIGQDAQAVLRELQFVPQRTRPDTKRGVVGKRLDFNRLVAEVGQAARIDAIDRHVRSRRRGDDVAGRVEHHRRAEVVGSAAGNDVVDVVVDPFAHQEDRLSPAAHRREPLRHVLERIERVPRVERALGIVGVVQRIAGLAQVAGAIELRGLVGRRRVEPAPLRLVDGREQQPLVGGELLVGVGGAGRVHDRHQIVGAEAPLDELARRDLHALAAAEARVQVVDHHHVDAAVERALVGLDVGFDRRRRERAAGRSAQSGCPRARRS
jgi:hypothetical protein